MAHNSTQTEKAIEYFNSHKAEFLEDLKGLVRIPSVSFAGFDQKEVERSAQFTADLMKKHGLENVKVIHFKTAAPYVYGEWLKQKGAPTLLLYAHHDVQPPGRPEVWKSPAFEPTLRDGRLYARGAADDKAGVLLHMAAVGSFLKSVKELPVNVKVLIEGEEEVGSENLEPFLKANKELLQSDVMVIADAGNFDVGVPALTIGLRGLVAVQVEVRALNSPKHSGLFGGPVPDPVIALAKVIAKLTDDEGRLNIPALNKKVRPMTAEQKKKLAALPFDEKKFRHEAGMLPGTELIGGPADTYTKNWHLPAVSVNAIQASSRSQVANIINDMAWCKVGLRIVPDMNPHETAEILTNFIKENMPWGLEVKVTPDAEGQYWSTDTTAPAFEAAKVALKKGYGVEAVMMGCGASIPFVQSFSDALGAPALLVGVEDPMTNAHSENESLHVGDWENAVRSSIYLYSELAQRLSK